MCVCCSLSIFIASRRIASNFLAFFSNFFRVVCFNMCFKFSGFNSDSETELFRTVCTFLDSKLLRYSLGEVSIVDHLGCSAMPT